MKSRLLSTIFLIFFTLPLLSHAQSAASIDLINITVDPAAPNPGQSVNVFVESYSTDLNGASIVWLVDGKNFASGIGKKSIDIPAPALGKTTNVTAAIKTVEGREVRKIVEVKSGSVDIVWESQGFIPPFYSGRALYAYQNPVKVHAVPHLSDRRGSEIDPRTLIYKWTMNGKVMQDQSGYGKQTLTAQEDVPRPLSVKVEVSTSDGKEKAQSSVTLTPVDPYVSFYEDHPLYGVLYNKSLQESVSLQNQEINVRAVPYSFTATRAQPLTYIWSINNLERTDLSSKESIVLRTKGDTEGTSLISLRVTSETNLLQGADNSISIQFTKRKAADTNYFNSN